MHLKGRGKRVVVGLGQEGGAGESATPRSPLWGTQSTLCSSSKGPQRLEKGTGSSGTTQHTSTLLLEGWESRPSEGQKMSPREAVVRGC